jgi:poly[(R)-3-hydroxyalkanoate] polymerase subunit PhaC
MLDIVARQLDRTRNGLAYMAGTLQPRIAQTPRDLVWQLDKGRLWRYRNDDRRVRPPVLIVHSLVSKSYILDLAPGNSFIEFMLGEGFDVFLLDWIPAGPADAENTLETYVDHYIPKAMAATQAEADADELTVIGYCFAGVLTLLLAAGHPELPIRNLVTLTTPCDYTEMGFMSKMFLEGRLDPEDAIDDTGLVPAAAMDEGFQSLKPTDRITQQVNLFQNLHNEKWVLGYMAMNQWARDQVAFPGAAFRQTVDVLIRRNALMDGVIPFGRGEVRLEDITCPFLSVYCEQDTIVPARSTEPLVGLIGARDKRELRLKSGHVGLVAGRQSAKVARPQIVEWIRSHGEEREAVAV